jgi:hypothetical protein
LNLLNRITAQSGSGQAYQHALNFPAVEEGHNSTPVELRETEHLKRLTSDQIARSFLVNGRDDLRKLSDKLFDCSESVSLKSNGAVHSHSRCKHRLCALCSSINASKWQKEINRVMDHLKYDLIEDSQHHDETALVALKVTLNAGRTCPATELKSVIRDVLHTIWPRVLRHSAVKPHLEGAIRATEITVSKDPMIDGIPQMNPHLHCTILLRVPPAERANWRTWVDEISLTIGHYWVGAVSRRLKKFNIDRAITMSSQEIATINTQTTTDLEGWMKYSVKGAVTSLANALYKEDYTLTALEPISKIWAEIYRAIKGIRLIATSGSFSDSLDDAREELLRESEPASRARDNEDAKITHRWSYPQNAFIPIDVWKSEYDKPPYFRDIIYHHYIRRNLPPIDRESIQPDDTPPLNKTAPQPLKDELFLYTQDSHGAPL